MKNVHLTGGIDSPVTISWDRPEPPNGQVDKYYLYLSDGGTMLNDSAVNTSRRYDDLCTDPGMSNLTVKVAAVNIDGGQEFESNTSLPETKVICGPSSGMHGAVSVVVQFGAKISSCVKYDEAEGGGVLIKAELQAIDTKSARGVGPGGEGGRLRD